MSVDLKVRSQTMKDILVIAKDRIYGIFLRQADIFELSKRYLFVIEISFYFKRYL